MFNPAGCNNRRLNFVFSVSAFVFAFLPGEWINENRIKITRLIFVEIELAHKNLQLRRYEVTEKGKVFQNNSETFSEIVTEIQPIPGFLVPVPNGRED